MNTGFGLEEAVREARERTDVPGVAAGLWRDGETAFATDGVLALGGAESVLHDTPFRIASITKPFTATVGDLLRFATHHLAEPGPLHEPHVDALGARYALGWWVRTLETGRSALDHEGSVAGYQSLLLLVPEEALALAVLTNSWRGSGLIRRVVESLGLSPGALAATPLPDAVAGTYALDGVEAVVEVSGDGLTVSETERDPVTGSSTATRFPVQPLGGRVYGFARGVLMSHRLDFPWPGLARIGWVVLARVES